MNYAFITVTDYSFFPGTVATVNSVLQFHPETLVYVIQNLKHPLTPPQIDVLGQCPQVRLMGSDEFDRAGRFINAWELKAYACLDLSQHYDVIIGIDSDCLLCSPVTVEIKRAYQTQGFVGGQDGDGADYDEDYAVYGIKIPARNPRYLSTSLFFVAVNAMNSQILAQWAACCSQAVFNGQGPYPGHGDQGVLNAVLWAANQSSNVELLPNQLWSQHWVYWDTVTDFQSGSFVNRAANGQKQRSFHCGGGEKFWLPEHRNRVLTNCPLQTYPYVWFLSMFWFGSCRKWGLDPLQYLPPASHHLVEDLYLFLPQILQVYPNARKMWDDVTDTMLDRALNGIPRALSLGGGSMTELIDLVSKHPSGHRFVEIGSYEGGSILTLALRFANRDIDFYSVESFMGNFDGTMDGHRLPSRRDFLENISKFPSARVKLVPGDAGLAVTLFDESSIDFLFIDGCHNTPDVLRDIDVWKPKLRRGGIIAGDDYGWESVREAVLQRFPNPTITPSGNVWWLIV